MAFCLDIRSLLARLLLGCCVLCWWLLPGVGARDRMLYWNISNPIFKLSGVNRYLVPKNDRLVIVCPTNGLEFYRLYWTHNAEAAVVCQSVDSQVFLLLQCASAGDSGAILVTDFSPIPGAPTFDRTVHVFTPSSGSRVGLNQTQGGACMTRNMRLTVDIGNPDSMTPPAAQPSSTTAAETTRSAAAATASSAAAATGGGGRGPTPTASSNDDESNKKPPTAQDLARRAQTNVIVGAVATLPSVALIAAAALCLTATLRLSAQ